MDLFRAKTIMAGLACSVIFIGVALLTPEILTSLAYLRDAIANGQWWRLLTGHYVHFTLYHALMNAAGLVLVCLLLLNKQSLLFFCGINIALPVLISLGLWWLFRDIDQYRGYSGVIYGLISAGLVLEWQQNKSIYSLALILLTAKIAYEQLPNYDVNYLVAEIGVPVAIEAHLLGFVGGVVIGLTVLAYRRQRQHERSGAAEQ